MTDNYFIKNQIKKKINKNVEDLVEIKNIEEDDEHYYIFYVNLDISTNEWNKTILQFEIDKDTKIAHNFEFSKLDPSDFNELLKKYSVRMTADEFLDSLNKGISVLGIPIDYEDCYVNTEFENLKNSVIPIISKYLTDFKYSDVNKHEIHYKIYLGNNGTPLFDIRYIKDCFFIDFNYYTNKDEVIHSSNENLEDGIKDCLQQFDKKYHKVIELYEILCK